MDMIGELLLVDENDSIIGYGEKMTVHQKGILHRTFSIFIYDQSAKKILIQKRAKEKYHSGGLWSNSCCSHQYRGEQWIDAIKRCIADELGIKVNIQECKINIEDYAKYCMEHDDNVIQTGVFRYFSDYGDMKENEIDHVFICSLNERIIKEISPNPKEIDEIQWITFSELEKWYNGNHIEFTSWFLEAYKLVVSGIQNHHVN